MRLSQLQTKIIKREVLDLFGVATRITLFGSKANDKSRGGDIDLMIEVDKNDDNLWRKVFTLNANIQQKLGEQKIDIITKYKGQKLQDIHKEAIKTGIIL